MNQNCAVCKKPFQELDVLVKVRIAANINGRCLTDITLYENTLAHHTCPKEEVVETNRKLYEDELNLEENQINFNPGRARNE